MEGIFNFVQKLARFLLTLGLQRWYIVGAYVPPNDAPDVHHIEQVLEAELK